MNWHIHDVLHEQFERGLEMLELDDALDPEVEGFRKREYDDGPDDR